MSDLKPGEVNTTSLVDDLEGYHDVPSQDSADDAQMRDVIGKKSDTVGGDSLVSLSKILSAALAIVDGFHDVPSQNSVDNAQSRDVAGNKTDTTAGNSIVSLVKIVDALHDVPTADSVANSQMRDVIGNKTDTHSANSIYGRTKTMLEHVHSAAKCYPTGAGGVTVTGAGAWALGNFAEIVPVSTITGDFDIHYLVVEAVSAADTYELVLYAATTEIGRVRFAATGTPNNLVFPDIPFQCALQSANTQIQAKLMTAGGGNDTCTISLFYHTY